MVFSRITNRNGRSQVTFASEDPDLVVATTTVAAAATVLINSESGKVCVITACGGSDMTRWLPLIDGVEAYAREEGCKCVRIYGRKGWLRVLDGYRTKHVIMDKDLTCVSRGNGARREPA